MAQWNRFCGAFWTRIRNLVSKRLPSDLWPLSTIQRLGRRCWRIGSVFGPEARTQVVAALLNQRDRIPVLLTALEKGEVETASIEIAARARLMEDSDSSI